MADDSPTPAPGVAFWVTAVAGAAIVAFGVRGLLTEESAGAASAGRWFLGGALALDLLVVPVAAVVGLVVRRVAPGWAWPPVRAGLLTSAVLVVFAWPLVVDAGGPVTNPTSRPRDYATGLAVALVATWLVVGGLLVVRRVRRVAG